MTKGRDVSQVISLICEECEQPFNNNGRNPQKIKRFCSNHCAVVNCTRKWKLNK
jgi:hypothetical protein